MRHETRIALCSASSTAVLILLAATALKVAAHAINPAPITLTLTPAHGKPLSVECLGGCTVHHRGDEIIVSRISPIEEQWLEDEFRKEQKESAPGFAPDLEAYVPTFLRYGGWE